MPPVDIPTDETSAFTVINHEDEKREQKRRESSRPPQRNINVVKPFQRSDDEPSRTHLNSALDKQPMEPVTAPAGPQTILDPKFSRALDFKLRRLKEKEILQTNLRRPTRCRRRNGVLAASNPNISTKDRTSPGKMISQSNPRLEVIGPDDEKISPNVDQSPSPGRKSRSRKVPDDETEKPRFVTTVKSGQFLLPPPEIACLLGLESLYPRKERDKMVYSYASKPKAVSMRPKRSTAARKHDEGLPKLCNGEAKRPLGGGDLFRGVRALVAGVVGIRHAVDCKHEDAGSVGTTRTHYSNLMHDKRVVRGSVFAAHPQAAGDGIESAANRAAKTRRRALAKRAAAARLRPSTPPPAPGRKHHPIQTEYYLEELFDKGVEMTVGVQTDLFADRPSTPIYVPAKTGADAFTQIYPGDLFDFDLEVQPILEVLVGKTAEQALAEVAQEEELATLREQQRRYCELRDAERAERERLASQDQRLHQEKERRVAEARLAKEAATEARERVAAATLVQGYVAELLPSVLAGLRDQGYLLERVRRGVDEEFMPWLVREVSNEIESIITSRDVITEIVHEVVTARAELLKPRGDTEPLPDSDSHSLLSTVEGEQEATPDGMTL